MKINPTPYRISNLIFHYNEHFTISGSDLSDGFVQVKLEEIGEWVGIEDIEPIELTEDWLRRLGFSKKPFEPSSIEEGYYYSLSLSNEKFCDLALLSNYDEEGDEWTVYLFPYDNLVYRYVHQIQNLVHSITRRDIDVIA